jgi:ABC-type uncharacterized transport system auxiliary subunit
MKRARRGHDTGSGEYRQRMVTMKKTTTTIVFGLAALVVLASCAGKVKYPNYYTLNAPPPPDPPTAPNAHTILAIYEFRAPTYLRQREIVYKTSPEQIGFYAYHRWAVDPRDFVTNSVIDRLRASGMFARVQAYDGDRDVNYVLSGRLEKLEELDYQGGVKVQVALSAQMISVANGATVWTNAVSEIGDVNKHDVPTVVSEMNLTMQRAIEELVTPLSSGWAAGTNAAQK